MEIDLVWQPRNKTRVKNQLDILVGLRHLEPLVLCRSCTYASGNLWREWLAEDGWPAGLETQEFQYKEAVSSSSPVLCAAA